MRIKSNTRYELKYLLSWQQRHAMLGELAAYMIPDQHGCNQTIGDQELGTYAITSLYYDTVDYRAYWDKLEGVRFRRKVRVRIYGDQQITSKTPVYLEIKQRQNKTLTKKRVFLPYENAISLSRLPDLVSTSDHAKERNNESYDADDARVLNEVAYLHRTFDLRPVCVVRYTRLALNGDKEYPDLRVTFDTELKCRSHDLSLLSVGIADGIYFFPPTACIMEIKVNNTVPYWLAQLVNKHGCTAQRVSKYCVALEACALVNQQSIIVNG
ncbi:polyphosphate polymerase domain-containing protein [Chloroflexi bacterium TSY]|nr:polyphosphate polymerase domain-containing protein [Chloroflexi bacterium TSY]